MVQACINTLNYLPISQAILKAFFFLGSLFNSSKKFNITNLGDKQDTLLFKNYSILSLNLESPIFSKIKGQRTMYPFLDIFKF